MSAFHRLRFRRLQRLLPLGLSRRHFLRGAAGFAALPLLQSCGISAPPEAGQPVPEPPPVPSPLPAPAPVGTPPKQAAFLHGVASGDPLTDRVILWTRVTPDAATVTAGALVQVDYVVSLTPDLAAPVLAASFITGPQRDYTVKPDALGLASYTTYYFQFSVTLADGLVIRSPVGRTKTAPATAEQTQQVRIASAACNSYSNGFFNAFGRVGERADLDLFIHLGDYIYEGGGGTGERAHQPPREIISLADYRERHAQYKTDPDLQSAHRQHPWLSTWDDHETTNNSFATGAGNHTEGAEGCWEERVGWAIRAYFEWMPVREIGAGFDSPTADGSCPSEVPTGLLPNGLGRIYRKVSYGPLLDIFILDTRTAGRAEQNSAFVVSEEQTILGAAQREWFLQALPQSTATWKLIANGTGFAPLIAPAANPLESCVQMSPDEFCYVNSDAWDGYRFDRNAVYDAIESNGIQNSVFIFGDIHAVIACDLPRQPNDPLSYNPLTGEGSLGVELCCGGVAQVPVPVWTGLRASGQNPHMKHSNEAQLGYLLMDITPLRLQGEWYYSTIQARNGEESADPVMLQTMANSQRLTNSLTRSASKPNPPPLAP